MALAQLCDGPDPGELSNYPQRHAGGRNRQQRVQQQSAAVRRTEVSHPLSRRVIGQIDLRRVLSHQDHRIPHASLDGLLGMRSKNLLGMNPIVVPKAISRLDAGSAQGLGATCLRMFRKAFDNPRQPKIQSGIRQPRGTQFLPCPTHDSPPFTPDYHFPDSTEEL